MPLIEFKNLDPRMLTHKVVERLIAYRTSNSITGCWTQSVPELWMLFVEHAVTKEIRSSDFPGFGKDTMVTFDFSPWREAATQNVVVIVRGLFVRPDRTRDTRNGLLYELDNTLSSFIALGWGLELWTESIDLISEGYRAR